MKTLIVIFALLAATSVIVYSQAGFTVKPRDFRSYRYIVLDIQDPTPSTAVAATTPASSAAVRPGGARTTGPSTAATPRLDRRVEDLLNQRGDQGFRLIQVLPIASGHRFILEKEIPPTRTPR